MGAVTAVEGGYVTWDRGEADGVATGMTVVFHRGAQRVGSGRVSDVRAHESVVDMEEVTGVVEIKVGDRADAGHDRK